MSRIGAERAARRARRQGEPPDDELAERQRGERAEGEPAGEHVVDDVVADAERARHERGRATPTPSAPMTGCQTSATGRRPVGPLDGEQAPGDQRGEQPARDAETRRTTAAAEAGEVVGRHVEQRPGAEQRGVDAAGDARRHHERDERPRRELEQQQLDGQHDGGERRAERRRHAGGGARLRAGSCARAARRGATWPSSEPSAPPVTMIGPSAPNGPPVPMATAADSGLATAVRGRDAALADEHRLHRLGDAVAADDRRPRGQQRRPAGADHGDDDQSRDRGGRSANVGSVPAPLVEEDHVGEQPDEVDEHPRRPPPPGRGRRRAAT